MKKLFEKAFEYKATKLWKKLSDSHLFAVRHSDETISYCCVMGNANEYLAFAAYHGDEGLESYRKIGFTEDGEINHCDDFEYSVSQDCIICTFLHKDDFSSYKDEWNAIKSFCKENKIKILEDTQLPLFERFTPFKYPCMITEEVDKMYLLEAFDAALDVAHRLETSTPAKLGLRPGEPFNRQIPLLEKTGNDFKWSKIALSDRQPTTYISPTKFNDLAIAKIKKSRKKATTWACDIMILPEPISLTKGRTKKMSFFPFAQFIVNVNDGLMLNCCICETPGDYSKTFINKLLQVMQLEGKPHSIIVTNKRALKLYEHLAEDLNINIIFNTDCPELEEAEQDCVENLQEMDSSDDELFNEFRNRVIALITNPIILKSLSDNEFSTIMTLVSSNDNLLTKEQMKILEHENKQRNRLN